MTSKTAEPDKKLTQDEMVDSLTGFEELAIEQTFDAEVFELSFLKRLRALAMIQIIREGNSKAEAHKTVMGLTQAQLVERFADSDDEDGEDAQSDFPVTESGKDAAEPA